VVSLHRGLGRDALLDFRLEVVLDGEKLSQSEVRELVSKSEGLALVPGSWVEVDAERLNRTLARFGEVQRRAAEQGISFQEAMHMLAGADGTVDGDSDAARVEWAQVIAGPRLAETPQSLRSQEGLTRVDPGSALKGTLRPYQQVCVQWLCLLARLGLGACLADDMGPGKTIQVLALLLILGQQSDGIRRPSLLVAPASLLANWAAELERFLPMSRGTC